MSSALSLAGLCLAAVAVVFLLLARGGAPDWRTASREPVGLAPDPAAHPGAIVQVYSARAWGWRSYFGVHTWIAVKPAGAAAYTTYEVIGWPLRYGDSALAIRTRVPD